MEVGRQDACPTKYLSCGMGILPVIFSGNFAIDHFTVKIIIWQARCLPHKTFILWDGHLARHILANTYNSAIAFFCDHLCY
jgi:hypothetical protein